MNNELDRMEQAFRQQREAGRPSDAARQETLRAAMEAFGEENSKARQGTSVGNRPRERGNNWITALKRNLTMNFAHPKLSYMLAGGTSLAVLTIAAINLQVFNPQMFTAPVDRLAEQPKVLNDKEEIAVSADAGQASEADQLALNRAEPKKSAEKRMGFAQQHSAGGKAKRQFAPAPMSALVSKQVGGATGLRSRRDNTVQHYQDQGRDKFSEITPNRLKLVGSEPVSTFSVDVDTASYSFVRSALNRGVLPQKDAVRVEELINYFDYDYAAPDDRAEPFKTNVSVMPTPWNTNTKLMRIGIKGFDLPKSDAPKANLVFLLDTSGSMNSPDKLPLLRNSFKLLLSSLKPDDTVAIVTYAGSAGTVLEPTRAADKNKILAALDQLNSGGSTAGAEGIRQAYQLAERNLDKKGVNRVILATDGDFNVGISNPEELKSFVERKRKSGVTLSVLGFGHGNYNDQLMQTLAQNGNGNAAYIDTLSEARKVLVEEAGSTLFTIAKDVKLQLEFNPAQVSEYRLIGYETRLLNREDFNNDKVDAGDIGAGHTVTALYEITPAGSASQQVDGLRYQSENTARATSSNSNEYAFMKIRYKLPDSSTSTLIETAVTKASETSDVKQAPRSSRFAAAVAAFGQILRGGRYTSTFSYDDVITLAQSAKGEDRFGYRAEFINLVRLAKSAAALEAQKP